MQRTKKSVQAPKMGTETQQALNHRNQDGTNHENDYEHDNDIHDNFQI
jgi:hypothetical protein